MSESAAVLAPQSHTAEYLRLKALAQRGSAAAQHRLGFMFFNGEGVACDPAAA